MTFRFSANAGFFGLRRDRFNQYQPHRDLSEMIALIARAKGIQGIELKYPKDFLELALLKDLLEKHELELVAINVDTKDFDRFSEGALSASNPDTRRFVVDRLCSAMDIAAELDVEIITTCPLADAYDYPFQIDYQEAWERLIETVQMVVNHRSDVRFLLEYQPHEPHARIMLSDVGKLLFVISEIDAPNLGANLDVGHSFAAGESPAESAALLARRDRLWYLHSNDNTGEGGDWDMLSGSVHLWHWIELIFFLKRINYQGWIGADIMPKFEDPSRMFETNVKMIQRMEGFIEKVGMHQIESLLLDRSNISQTYELLTSFMFPE
jgi:xylose isomerase